MNWRDIRNVHSRAADKLAATAERIPLDRWTRARAEGKWSPAEILEHLNLAYDSLLRELAGGPGMQIRTKWWQRLILRARLVPKLLRGEPFPAGARAPRETRPAAVNADQPAAIAGFRERAAALDRDADEAIAARRRVRLTHAYFGAAPVAEAVLLCARHIEHHQKQLEEAV